MVTMMTMMIVNDFLLFTGGASIPARLPLHISELKDIKPQLSSLIVLYKIDAVSFHSCCYHTRILICFIVT